MLTNCKTKTISYLKTKTTPLQKLNRKNESIIKQQLLHGTSKNWSLV